MSGANLFKCAGIQNRVDYMYCVFMDLCWYSCAIRVNKRIKTLYYDFDFISNETFYFDITNLDPNNTICCTL
jgi:hypothetical protein